MESEEQVLSHYLQSVVNPTADELGAFLQKIKYVTMPKHKRLLQLGSYCHKMHFVIEGYLKYVMRVKDKDVVVHFATPGKFVADFFSYYSARPAISSIYTISECRLALIEKQALEDLYASYKVWERFGRLVAEQAAVRQILDKIKLQTLSTEERYLTMIAEKPEMLHHIKLGDLAQSLGITQETLSRIRRRIINVVE